MDPDAPAFRVTIRRDGVVRLIDWAPWLTTSGPLNTLLDGRGRAGVFIADLSIVRDEEEAASELVVDVRTGDRPRHRATLATWAALVGYSRMWIGSDVIELEPNPGGRATTRCSGCGVRMVDHDAEFWDLVRGRGAFPSCCCLCGGDLPQWTPERQGHDAQRDPAASTDPTIATKTPGWH
jgi:hypothetical protein